jgi:hypothetical protein
MKAADMRLSNSADNSGVVVRLVAGEALRTSCDVLVIKYSQVLDGTVRAAVRLLKVGYPAVAQELPQPGDFSGLYKMSDESGPLSICFVGVTTPTNFLYRDIEEFGSRALATLAGAGPRTKVLGVTLLGQGYGLDELACFDAQLTGMLSSLRSGDAPAALREILFIERNQGRSERLARYLQDVDVDGGHSQAKSVLATVSDPLTAMVSPSQRPTVFVAMPFSPAFDDVFTFGIQQVLHQLGFKCERIDRESFTGDVLAEIRRRISRCSLVIADLSGANPNVYLEVGYAWASERPTVLLFRPDPAAGTTALEFDTRGQKCIRYSSVTDLSERLTTEIHELQQQGTFSQGPRTRQP